MIEKCQIYTIIVSIVYLPLLNVSGQTKLRNDTALYRLNSFLFDGYDQYVKPVRNSSTVISVTVDFTLKQVLEIVS